MLRLYLSRWFWTAWVFSISLICCSSMFWRVASRFWTRACNCESIAASRWVTRLSKYAVSTASKTLREAKSILISSDSPYLYMSRTRSLICSESSLILICSSFMSESSITIFSWIFLFWSSKTVSSWRATLSSCCKVFTFVNNPSTFLPIALICCL